MKDQNLTKVSVQQSLKRLNLVMSIILVVLFLFALFVVFGLKFENTSTAYNPIDWWIEGLGNIYIFVIHFILNGIISILCFLILLIAGIRKKALKNIHTIINLLLLLGAIFLPCMVLFRYH